MMTPEEFLAGAETPTQREAREEAHAYSVSDEGFDELRALIEQDAYDGPTGNA